VAKYVYAYTGGGMAQTEEEQAAAMAAWGAWFGQLGSAVVDGGNPFGASTTVGSGGSVGLTGYSVIQADSLEAAAKLTSGCPILASGGAVDVYETIEVM
jgi:hypothetical protein